MVLSLHVQSTISASNKHMKKKLRYFVLFFFNIYTKSKESGAYFLLIAPFQAPGSHT